jgi:hypothetical protein
MTTICLILLVLACAHWPLGMISIGSEELLSFTQLAKRIPRRRNDRPVHLSTIHRWRHPGIGGIRLECIRIGGVWHTSMEAFQRWCDRLSTPDDPTDRSDQRRAVPRTDSPGADAHSVSDDNRLSQDEIERTLDELGL